MADQPDIWGGNGRAQTDEYGNPVHQTAGTGLGPDLGSGGQQQTGGIGLGADVGLGSGGQQQAHRGTGTGIGSGGQQQGMGQQGGKGMMEKIKDQLPGSHGTTTQTGQQHGSEKGTMEKIKEN